MTVFAFGSNTEAASGPDKTWLPSDRITHAHADLLGDSDFGSALSANDGIAVVGAPSENAAYVYESIADVWHEQAMLEGPAGFGSAVDIHGSSIIVAQDNPWVSYVLG